MEENDFGEIEFFGDLKFLGLGEGSWSGGTDDGEGVTEVAGGGEDVEVGEGDLHFELCFVFVFEEYDAFIASLLFQCCLEYL